MPGQRSTRVSRRGAVNPFVEDSETQYYGQRYSAVIAETRQRVAALREAGGNDIDVCVEIRRRLTIQEAIVLGRAIEELRPFLYLDPTTPDSIESMAEIARSIDIPIATGERIHTIWEFRELLQQKAGRFIRPDSRSPMRRIRPWLWARAPMLPR